MNIDNKMNDVEELTTMIEFAMRIVNALPEKALRDTYSDEMKKVIEEYNNEVTLLKEALENHFEKEKIQNLPSSLSLRRAYNNLRFL